MAAKLATEVEECGPVAAWELLKSNTSARLVDVRTRAEWAYVGAPDLSEINQKPLFVEWQSYPEMRVNRAFADELLAALGPELPGSLLFLCRSGVRSMQAAREMANRLDADGTPVRCVNIREGFEGDRDEHGHRGSQNGWKAHGLSWRQG